MGFYVNLERCMNKCPISGLIGCSLYEVRKLNGETNSLVHFTRLLGNYLVIVILYFD